MRYQFFAALTAMIRLDDRTFGLLESCMSVHYDGTVKATTELGGFMYGARNRRNFTDGDPEYKETLELTSNQLQLCMKALEMRRYCVGNDLDELDFQLHKLWHLLVSRSKHVNSVVLAEGGEI